MLTLYTLYTMLINSGGKAPVEVPLEMLCSPLRFFPITKIKREMIQVVFRNGALCQSYNP